MAYSKRFEQALLFAHQLHAEQVRKCTQTPYITHLMAVAALVGENGGSEDQVIAALLHDAIEDQGGLETASLIRARFGREVAEIVEACTDTHEEPKPSWRLRKERYLATLVAKDERILLVSVSDKLHNCRTILMDIRREGLGVFERFTGRRQGTLWYYRALVEAYRSCWKHPLVDELDDTVGAIERWVQKEVDFPKEGKDC